MNEAGGDIVARQGVPAQAAAPAVSIASIFLTFLIIGSTSFGGPVPYLRDTLVARRQWLDDKAFVELLSISQSLPGLNATNMAILVGDKLRGAWGAKWGSSACASQAA
jgi:chromate transporter